MKSCVSFGFCGSGSFAASCLSLLSARISPKWVVTNAPKPSGRGMHLTNTPVFDAASELGVQCFTTERLSADAERIEWIKANLPDAILVIDFGHMIKEPLLSAPALGCINIHPSLLPAYRGSAPLQRAMMDGCSETGVTLFRLDAGMDSGPVLSQVTLEITDCDDYASMLEKSSVAGVSELLRFICDTDADKWEFRPQTSCGVSLAPKIDKAEGKIDWNETALCIFNKIRAIGLSPGTFCNFNGKRLRIHKAVPVDKKGAAGALVGIESNMPVIACGDGAIKLISVQPEGKKAQNADEWLRGSRMSVGDKLS